MTYIIQDLQVRGRPDNLNNEVSKQRKNSGHVRDKSGSVTQLPSSR
jgi:hypothetical protein